MRLGRDWRSTYETRADTGEVDMKLGRDWRSTYETRQRLEK